MSSKTQHIMHNINHKIQALACSVKLARCSLQFSLHAYVVDEHLFTLLRQHLTLASNYWNCAASIVFRKITKIVQNSKLQ
jgi:hypothetical protein